MKTGRSGGRWYPPSASDKLRKVKERTVARYDGQTIWLKDGSSFDLGHYLGGGTAGSVYEAIDTTSQKPVAIKIINPIGYKLATKWVLQRCIVISKGVAMEPLVRSGRAKMRREHVWWLLHPNSKQFLAAYEDARSGTLRELPLSRCVDIWGLDPPGVEKDAEMDSPEVQALGGAHKVLFQGILMRLPLVPKKFINFVRSRRSIYREISNMSEIGAHTNVLCLYEALEWLQDSKSTIFLVLELATGGELFDRIKLDCGTDERSARVYFRQLLSGVAYCHDRGVCHRDLKPENLLLSDTETGAVLKIADFGLSALFRLKKSGTSCEDKGGNSINSHRGSPTPSASGIHDKSGWDNGGGGGGGGG